MTQRTARFARAAALSLLCSAAAVARTTAPIEEDLRQAFERATYSFKDSGHGSWQSTNREQQLTLEFDSEAGRVTHPGGALGFRLIAYGYGDRLATPSPARLTATENRVEYDRGNLTEWYVNGSQGLEQGFTLTHRPAAGWMSQPLVIALGVTGDFALTQKNSVILATSTHGVVLRYAGLTARDALGRTLPSRLEVHGREIRLIVEDRGARYPVVIDPTWSQQAELTGPVIENGPYNLFGYFVAVSGNTAVIGAPYTNNYFGAAYVFVQSGSTWTLQAELNAFDGLYYDLFGISVAVSGDIAIIGATNHPLDQDNGAGPGAAYVFARNGTTWTLQQELVPSDGVLGGGFGTSVSVSGNTAVIGALGEGAWVFVQSESTWTQQQKLMALDWTSLDNFGGAVAVSGDTAVIGASNHPIETDGNSGPGAAYVFVRNGTTWTQQAELTPFDGAAGDAFGTAVSASGGVAVVGAVNRHMDLNGNGGPGAAYVFVQTGTNWNLQAELTAPDGGGGDAFGQSVSVSGGGALIGAQSHVFDVVAGTQGPGAAYMFVQSGIAWTLQQEITASDGVAADLFGRSVSLSGGTAVVGATVHTVGDNNGQGSAYTFQAPPASLSISATHSSPIFQGGPGTIILTVANTGGPLAGAATVSDTIDAGFTIDSASPGCLVSGQVVTCSVAANTFAASTALSVFVTASGSASASISNTATLSDETDTITGSTSSDNIPVATAAPNVDSSLIQLVLSGSTDQGTCAAGNRTLTATDQLQNNSGATLTNPYAVVNTLSQGNTLLSQSANSVSVSPGADVTFTFHIQLASCNRFQLFFDVRSN